MEKQEFIDEYQPLLQLESDRDNFISDLDSVIQYEAEQGYEKAVELINELDSYIEFIVYGVSNPVINEAGIRKEKIKKLRIAAGLTDIKKLGDYSERMNAFIESLTPQQREAVNQFMEIRYGGLK